MKKQKTPRLKLGKVKYTPEMLNAFWDDINVYMMQSFNRTQIIEALNIPASRYNAMVKRLSDNKKYKLKQYYYKVYKRKSDANSLNQKMTSYDLLNYTDICILIKEKRLSKMKLIKELNINTYAIESWMKYRLTPTERNNIRALLSKYQNRSGTTNLPPTHFKKHSGFEYKETNKSTVLPIGQANVKF